jgi:hypothetical protein
LERGGGLYLPTWEKACRENNPWRQRMISEKEIIKERIERNNREIKNKQKNN